MRVVNKSRKIISIAGEPLLPGKSMELPEGYDKHPSIVDYLGNGTLVDAAKASSAAGSGGLSDEEREKIAEEAVAKYKAEQEALAAAQAEKDAEIKAVNKMKKDELASKAIGMGIEISDSDTADNIKAKILEQLNQ